MRFDEFVGSLPDTELNEHARLAVADALSTMQPDIVSGKLDGTEISYRVSLRGREHGDGRDVLAGHYKSGTPDPYAGAYNYGEIAHGKHADSMATGLPVIELLREGVDCQSQYHGNVVVPLSKTLDAVISGSGLSEEGDQVFCGLVGFNFQRRLLLAWHELAVPN